MTEKITRILKRNGINISDFVTPIPPHSETEITPFHSTLGQLAQSLDYASKAKSKENIERTINLTNKYLSLLRDFKDYRTEQLTPESQGNIENINESLTNHILRKEKELKYK